MIPRGTLLLLPALFLLSPVFALAQDDAAEAYRRTQQAEAAKQQYEAQRTALEQQAIREKSIADMTLFLNDPNKFRGIPPTTSGQLQASLLEFQQSIPKFRAATEDYREVVGQNGKLEKFLKNISTQADVLLRYLDLVKMKHPQPDPSEFKGFTKPELAWETLNSAERIGMFLDLAVQVEKQDVLAPEMLEFMYKLDGELLRLKWLASHTKG